MSSGCLHSRSDLVQGLTRMIGLSALLFTQEKMLVAETHGSTITVVCLALIFGRVLIGEGICVNMLMEHSSAGSTQLNIVLVTARMALAMTWNYGEKPTTQHLLYKAGTSSSSSNAVTSNSLLFMLPDGSTPPLYQEIHLVLLVLSSKGDSWDNGNRLAKDLANRIFTILKQSDFKYLTHDGFKALLRELLATQLAISLYYTYLCNGALAN
ncbi:hypothetical protein F0562_015848 [Nyssa sinensis]|uniref:Uncharacterized protein n=1 Tax=Nyssa sinensis TaxID=561372 RepID=A0A5J4ZKY9_9ASTE|nr:hypothetical protein F0562_015848 [Nyssa sinensis]